LGRRIDQKGVNSSGEVGFSTPLSSGVYFVQLASEGAQKTAKLVLLQ
jgi:hypothetical protein